MTARYRSSISVFRRCSTRLLRSCRMPRLAARRGIRARGGAPRRRLRRSRRRSDQYHSETPSNVSVTQTQPSNVNVSIRINSPGDDGPVVQINNAGGSAVVEQVQQVVQRPRRSRSQSRCRPGRAAAACPPRGTGPGRRPASVAPRARAPRRRSRAGTGTGPCDERSGRRRGRPRARGLPGIPDPGGPDMDDLLAAAAPIFAAVMPSDCGRPPAAACAAASGADVRSLERRRRRRGPPPAAGRAPPAQPLLAGASAHAPPASAARPRHAERAAARAQPGPGEARPRPCRRAAAPDSAPRRRSARWPRSCSASDLRCSSPPASSSYLDSAIAGGPASPGGCRGCPPSAWSGLANGAMCPRNPGTGRRYRPVVSLDINGGIKS